MEPTREQGEPVRPGPSGETGPGNAPDTVADRETMDAGTRNDRLWPTLIILGLALVFLVNGLFIYIAVKGADEVVPSYLTEER
jgi:hypothetical protein